MFVRALYKVFGIIIVNILCACCIIFATPWLSYIPLDNADIEDTMQRTYITNEQGEKSVFSHRLTLQNGMTVIVREQHTIPKVSIQMFYNVGSKDEQVGEKGIAHLIEHMIFKGTSDRVGKSLNLSESDLNVFAHKLSGYMNAFTSYDVTGYEFDMPTQHYQYVFPVMADYMERSI